MDFPNIMSSNCTHCKRYIETTSVSAHQFSSNFPAISFSTLPSYQTENGTLINERNFPNNFNKFDKFICNNHNDIVNKISLDNEMEVIESPKINRKENKFIENEISSDHNNLKRRHSNVENNDCSNDSIDRHLRTKKINDSNEIDDDFIDKNIYEVTNVGTHPNNSYTESTRVLLSPHSTSPSPHHLKALRDKKGKSLPKRTRVCEDVSAINLFDGLTLEKNTIMTTKW